MHLEDVNIEGFKSYSERTNMGFGPGIGVIIGNNGVGKSNILSKGELGVCKFCRQVLLLSEPRGNASPLAEP